MIKVDAVLLAAGLSDRMLGSNKLLLPYKGSSIISSTYEALQSSEVDCIVVVTGRDEFAVRKKVNLGLGDQFVHNALFKNGMTGSIQVGLKQIQPSEALMVCLGDMPLLTSADYNFLIKAFRQDGSRGKILVPWFKEKRANPVIFGSDYFDEILSHQSPNGCAEIIKNHSEKVLNLQVDNKRFILDIDTPEDFENMISDVSK